ncbi:MAG: hypothetical protein EAZ85_09215 [Bacteroidetes bacterium]|nr:MAG: hypothetical protein EAZ85_09215 [Bacteroidota bacterium]TAG88266.1 MAG: hypothetical protein EAZ20_08870 [Bacteroidota bacterium]
MRLKWQKINLKQNKSQKRLILKKLVVFFLLNKVKNNVKYIAKLLKINVRKKTTYFIKKSLKKNNKNLLISKISLTFAIT